MQTTIPGGAESTTDDDSSVADVHIRLVHTGLLHNRNIRYVNFGHGRSRSLPSGWRSSVSEPQLHTRFRIHVRQAYFRNPLLCWQFFVTSSFKLSSRARIFRRSADKEA